MEPQQDGILLKIQKNRKEPHQIILLKTDDEIDKVKNILEDAFNSIH